MPSLRSVRFAFGPQPAETGLDRGGRPVRGRPGPAGTVGETCVALVPPEADPLVGRGTGYAHLRSNVPDRTTRQDACDQDPTAVNGQPGITVGHEDLRVRCGA